MSRENLRQQRLEVRMSDAELAVLRVACERLEVKVSTFARDAALAEAFRLTGIHLGMTERQIEPPPPPPFLAGGA